MLAFLGAPAIGAVQPHVLRFADGMDVSTLNPWYATTANVTRLSALTMAKFTRFDRDGRLVPELLSEIPSTRNGGITAHGSRITWHLRRDARWSDGARFDGRDVLADDWLGRVVRSFKGALACSNLPGSASSCRRSRY